MDEALQLLEGAFKATDWGIGHEDAGDAVGKYAEIPAYGQ